MLQLAYFYSKFFSCWIICALGNTPFWGQNSVLGNIIALRVDENKYLPFFFFFFFQVGDVVSIYWV